MFEDIFLQIKAYKGLIAAIKASRINTIQIGTTAEREL